MTNVGEEKGNSSTTIPAAVAVGEERESESDDNESDASDNDGAELRAREPIEVINFDNYNSAGSRCCHRNYAV